MCKEQKCVICRKKNESGLCHIKLNKPVSKRQIACLFSHLWSLGKKNKRHESKMGTTGDVERGCRNKKETREGNGGLNMIKMHYMHT
jgi:hypothetical protein